MKQCNKCQEWKENTQFNVHSKRYDKLQSFCKECQKERSKKYYYANLEKHKRAVKDRKNRAVEDNREFLFNYLSNHPCVDCKTSDIRVLEFDHLDAKEKINGVAAMAGQGYGIKAIKQEIEKCEVRCKNCHTIKTYERMGGTWHDKYAPVA